MGNKPFTTIAAIIFLIMALVHVLRLVKHFEIMVGSHSVPMWGSIVAIVITGLLSWGLFREARR
ncbi:MAG TPA: hypothetical protein VFU80_05330 [Sphingomicrobium sp.]|nr:hypothetical protein [Sphingomicrobium sp.]